MSSKITAIEKAAADAVPDQAVEGLPHINAILGSLEEMRTAHTAAVRAVLDAQRQIADFRAMAEPFQLQITEREEVQNGLAIACIQGEAAAQKKWSDADKAIEDARRFLRQHKVAVPLFESWAKRSPAEVARLARQVEALEMELAKAILEAKLKFAHDQATR